ncbi:MAG: hypothetical protein R3B13_21020 [Polyangiaceae bacterium]
MTTDVDDFARAYVAASYLLDRRDEALMADISPNQSAQSLVSRLGHDDRQARAQALAAELARISRAVEARRIK